MTISYVGEYQLGNLIRNQVPFTYVCLESEPFPDSDHPLLVGMEYHQADGLLEWLEKKGGVEQPVVLICENGDKSREVAGTLAVAGYLNIFVVEGGLNGII